MQRAYARAGQRSYRASRFEPLNGPQRAQALKVSRAMARLAASAELRRFHLPRATAVVGLMRQAKRKWWCGPADEQRTTRATKGPRIKLRAAFVEARLASCGMRRMERAGCRVDVVSPVVDIAPAVSSSLAAAVGGAIFS